MKIITIPIVNGEMPKFLGAICYEGDKNVQRLEFTGAEKGVQYKLDLQHSDGAKNVLDLQNENGTLFVELDDTVQIPSGRYQAQLRTVGDAVWHSNKAFLTVRSSIDAVDAFPDALPTELAQLEARLTQIANHPPIPGEDGFWLLWDTSQGAYVKSTHAVQTHPVFVAEYGVTTYSQILQAWNAGKVILCRHGEYLSLLYRHKANTYFSFKTSTGNRVVTRSCYLNAWEYRSEDIP